MLFQQFHSAQRIREAAGARCGSSPGVVQFLRSVNTDADPETVLFEETAEFIRQQRRVRLQGIDDLSALRIALLETYRSLVEIRPGQGGLTAVPGEFDLRPSAVHSDALTDARFQHPVAHTARTRMQNLLFPCIVAILTPEVARTGYGLNQHGIGSEIIGHCPRDLS